MRNFDRVIRVDILPVSGEGKSFQFSRLLNELFAIEFEIEFGAKSTTKVKLFNVNQSTIDLCKANDKKYSSCEVRFGYADSELLLLSVGDIIQYKVNKQGADHYLEIQSSTGILPLNVIIPKESNSFQDSTISNILEKLFSVCEVKDYEIFLSDKSDKTLKKFTAPYTLESAISQLCYLGSAVYYFSNKKLVIESIEYGKKRTTLIPDISRESGMIGVPQIKGTTYTVKTLLDARIDSGSVVNLSFVNELGDSVDGEFKVQKGKHIAGSYKSDCYTEFETIKV